VTRLMAAHLDMTTQAAQFMLAKGHVRLDGRVLGIEERRLPVEALQGRMLCAGQRCARVLGSALAQRALPRKDFGTNRQVGESSSAPTRSLRLQSEDEQLSMI
jgi:hypothetical protein